MVRSQGAGLTIGRLAGAAGVGVETVRYYQRRGLLAVPDGDGAVRRYGAADVHRLRFIRSAQAAGFTLAEIGRLVLLDGDDDRAEVRAMAEARIAALDERIALLAEARTALATLARRCADTASGPCPILSAFDDAG